VRNLIDLLKKSNKAKIEAAEKAIRDKEAEDAAEKARIERDRLLAPDKEKLILLRDSIDGIAYPDVKSSDAKAITDQVNVELTRTIRMLSVEIEKL